MGITRRLATASVALAATTASVIITTTGSAQADMAKPTSTAAQHVTRHPASTALLLDIRTAKHDTFDRVVFDFRGGAPGYDVRYVTAVRYDPSDKPTTMPGRYYLQVRLNPASAYNTSGRH